MSRTKHLIVSLLIAIIVFISGKSQTQISGIININTPIESIDGLDLITVGNVSGFLIGDTVLVIQMKGGTYDTGNSALLEMNGTGRYEFIVIQQINTGTRQIEFRSNLINYSDYSASESMQMIRVPTYNSAKVIAPITCAPWDGQKGGVVAFIVNDTLTLNDSIYANAKGFLGGAYTQNSGLCPATQGNLHYTPDKTDSAGFKGEGLVSNSFTFKRGRGSVVNAGGGGYARYSGGGGGGNFGSGGRGGNMMETIPTCLDPNMLLGGSGGRGDKILPYYFGATGSEYRDRIFLGGGGGAGTGNVALAGTNGGNGGGIVFIIARNVVTNGKYICSNGGDINALASNNAGAGGGGAAGSILLSVDEITGPLNVSVKGGKGGSTGYCWGQGGGGGGGIVWFSLESLPFNNLKWGGGSAGGPAGACINNAFNGESGDTSNRFNAILNGFLFNLIGKEQTICYGDIPLLLKGSYPRGGDKNYKYQWQKRLKATTWENIPGAVSKDYQSSALYDSTYFRRIVKVRQILSTDTVIDSSKFVMVNVIPEIKFNEINADTAICYGLPAVTLRGKTPTGGLGGFSYLWESKTSSTNWSSAAAPNNQINFANTSNIQTLYYRRKVFSTFCMSISDVDTIIVYPKITGNSILSSQTICYNYFPAQLTGSIPSNGNGSYIYKWEKSEIDSSSWMNTGAATQNFAPPKLVNKTYYHRIVYSGLYNTCIDTSNWARISITPSIVNNSINSAQTICEGATPALFTGSLPTGGNAIYSYHWEKSSNAVAWDPIASATLRNYQHTSLSDTTYFRRIVLSGLLDCCKDTSDDIKITVQPGIQNNVISASQEICSGQAPAQLHQLSGSVSGGDKVTYNFLWEQKTTPTGSWNAISGTNNQNFQPLALTQTTYYHRKVSSGQCTDFSDSLKINVLSALSGNLLTGNNEVCRGLQPAIILGGNISGGEEGVYRYQWQDSTVGPWNPVSGATGTSYNPPVIPVKTYYRRVVKSGLNDCCVDNSDPFELRINELPVGNLNAIDTAICEGKAIGVKVSISGNNPFTIQMTDQTNNYEVSNLVSGLNTLNIVPLKTGTIQIAEIIDSKGCLAAVKPGSAIVRLVEVPIANAGLNADVCGLSFNLNATLSIAGTTGEWIKPLSAIYNPSLTDPHAVITVPSYGTYELLWKESKEFCSDTGKIIINFFDQPQKPVLPKDTVLFYQFGFNLTAPEPSIGNGMWSSIPAEINIISEHSPNTAIEDMNFGEYMLIWKVSNGNCIAMSDTMVIFVDDIKRYTGFSPNNDGINETFYFEGIDHALSKKIKILNRWGGVVFSDDNYQNNWKGINNNGQDLPDDTYFYILTVDGTRIYKGFVVLKR